MWRNVPVFGLLPGDWTLSWLNLKQAHKMWCFTCKSILNPLFLSLCCHQILIISAITKLQHNPAIPFGSTDHLSVFPLMFWFLSLLTHSWARKIKLVITLIYGDFPSEGGEQNRAKKRLFFSVRYQEIADMDHNFLWILHTVYQWPVKHNR